MTLRTFRWIEGAAAALCLALAVTATVATRGTRPESALLFLWGPPLVAAIVALPVVVAERTGRRRVDPDGGIEMPRVAALLVALGAGIYASQLPYAFGIDPVGRAFAVAVGLACATLAAADVFPDRPEGAPRTALAQWLHRWWTPMWTVALLGVAVVALVIREPLRTLPFFLLVNAVVGLLGGFDRRRRIGDVPRQPARPHRR